MPLETLLARLSSGKPLPPKTVALTFDDGYMDNYLNAFPILKKYHYPATVFMPANLVGKDNFWDISRGKTAVKMLTQDQIMEMLQYNISFQAHTYNHVVLIDVPLGRAKLEIGQSKELASLTGQPVQVFCYPSGRYNQQIKGLVQEAGFKYAFSTRQGRIHYGDDLYSLKRIRVTGLDLMPKFIAHLEITR
jgi:peptidoglycan/xylan/chitin deacetylase (PgdA/CDA1 family)